MTTQKTAISVLQQLKDVTTQLSDSQFTQPIEALGKASLGQHLRHTLEFFQCLENGCKNGWVNYDNRQHNKEIENNRASALALMEDLQNNINQQNNNPTINLEVSYGLQEIESEVVPTNYRRELIYNIEHAIHHMAIFKIGLREVAPEIALPPDFGVASSTLRYQSIAILSA
ncbi:MAG: hypothetical protein MUF68_01905 [Cyclobacteriaceae bacterium]|jgi:uncharacterized damage-inducible protein DinB|nr:hypothetical protein [Cyclobacteriaceae bacterium]